MNRKTIAQTIARAALQGYFGANTYFKDMESGSNGRATQRVAEALDQLLKEIKEEASVIEESTPTDPPCPIKYAIKINWHKKLEMLPNFQTMDGKIMSFEKKELAQAWVESCNNDQSTLKNATYEVVELKE